MSTSSGSFESKPSEKLSWADDEPEEDEQQVDNESAKNASSDAAVTSWDADANQYPSSTLYVPGYNQSWSYTDMMAYSGMLYYTAQAVASRHCSTCKRDFAEPAGVLHHMRDHKAHRDTPEAQEAAYVLQYQDQYQQLLSPLPAGSEWGWPVGYNTNGSPAYDADNSTVYYGEEYYGNADSSQQGAEQQGIEAPPSDVYTGSENGSSGALNSQESVGADGRAKTDGHGRSSRGGRRSSRRRNGRNKQHNEDGGKKLHTPPKPVKPEEYESAFPPLSPTGAGTPSPFRGLAKWRPAQSARKPVASLNANATSYKPSATPEKKSCASTEAAAGAESTPAKHLRAEAAPWVPPSPAAAISA